MLVNSAHAESQNSDIPSPNNCDSATFHISKHGNGHALESLHCLPAYHPLLFSLTGQYSSHVTPELGQLHNRHSSATAAVRYFISRISL